MAQIPDDLVQELLNDIEERGKEYARARARAAHLSDLKGITEAQLMKMLEAGGLSVVAAQKRDARASPSYLEVVKQLHDAIEDETVCEVKFRNAERAWESWRTLCANERAAS